MDIGFDALLKAVDVLVIIAIIGITEAVKRAVPERFWRWTPVVPLLLGIIGGIVLSPPGLGWRAVAKATLLYAGAASIAYELLRTTIFKSGQKNESGSSSFALVIAIFLAFLMALSGCARNRLISPAERGLSQYLVLNNTETTFEKKAGLPYTDADVFSFAMDIRSAYERKENVVRGIDLSADAAGVGLAAIPVIGSILGWALDLVPWVGIVTSSLNKLMDLFNASGREAAYGQGHSIVTRAMETYNETLVKNGGKIPGDRLTIDGWVLEQKLNAAIRLVRDALSQKISDPSDVKVLRAIRD